MTTLQLITETRDFYAADPSRRASTPTNCLYRDPNTNNRCAVGRCMTPGPWEEFEGVLFALLASGYTLQQILRPEYHDIPESVLHALQDWHDQDSHFTTSGLTLKGSDLINEILSHFQ